MILDIRYSSKIKKDLKLLVKQGKDMSKFAKVIDLLITKAKLPEKYKNHPLNGYKNPIRYDLHIEPDWILFYEVDETSIYLVRTGSHSDLI